MVDYFMLLSFVGATSLLAITPGPDNIYVLIQSLTNGVKFGLATVYGLMTGCLIHTSLVAFGVSAIIKANDALFFALKIVGATYLLYLAYRVFKSSSTIILEGNLEKQKTKFQLFKQGFMMNVLNPKVSIFFLALFPGFLFSTTLSTVLQFYVLGLLFILISLVIFSLIAIGAGKISTILYHNKQFPKTLKWLQIFVFIAIAFYILFEN
ncbi:LysE family translocator [Flavobacteriaceae bacterium F08102]|nr:LysE family translocator [Flavobacteriaceae bacterium F08102]